MVSCASSWLSLGIDVRCIARFWSLQVHRCRSPLSCATWIFCLMARLACRPDGFAGGHPARSGTGRPPRRRSSVPAGGDGPGVIRASFHPVPSSRTRRSVPPRPGSAASPCPMCACYGHRGQGTWSASGGRPRPAPAACRRSAAHPTAHRPARTPARQGRPSVRHLTAYPGKAARPPV